MAVAVHRRAGRSSVFLVAALIALAVLGWVVTDHRMAGMDAGPGTDPGTLGFYVSSWVVMMAAMMAPSISPMVLVYASIQRRRRQRGAGDRAVSVSLFIAGYFLTWTAFGLLAYGLFVGVRSLSIGVLRWNEGGRYLAGAVLATAALYQLTPAKDACLRRCRGPLDFVMGHWREGPVGAIRMGAIHGAWCVGCCWGLMAALFAVGVMSIPWMVLIAAIIAAEKLLPRPARTRQATAFALAALAIGVALWPNHVPALTLPDSAAATRAMRSMHAMPATPATHAMPAMRSGPEMRQSPRR
jgi:predicted metal-binding membrane protein